MKLKENPLLAHTAPHLKDYLDALWRDFRVQLEDDGIVFARLSEGLRLCSSCNLYFAPARTDQAYCRPACRQAAFQERQAK